MNIKRLTVSSIVHYKPFYRLVAIAVTVAVAVIAGSFVVGDSVRGTLIKRVEERLGKTETVIFSQYSYMSDAILKNQPVNNRSRGMLLVNGFVSVSGKLVPVTVWGIDSLEIAPGQVKINRALSDEIKSLLQDENIVLRLPASGIVPSGSMFVTDVYTTGLRLEINSVLSAKQGGNLNLKNEQIIPFNVFLNREELAAAMGVERKINLILSDRIISKNDFTSAWNYVHSGLNVKTENGATFITADRIFIQDEAVKTLCQSDSLSNRFYSYLANTISRKDKSIPYSFITAIDRYKGQALNSGEIILSDYAAKRLNAGLNDSVLLAFFVSRQFKTLITDSVFLKVKNIIPLEDLQADDVLKADFPGLSNTERCTDWSSDLPINMSLITGEDEKYWAKYRNTPKALVAYSTMSQRWKNAYGSATALKITGTDILRSLSPEMFGISIIYPRQTAVASAKSGVDFSTLFMALGFFIVLSAIILMMLPLSEMLFRRRDEIFLLQATGFPRKRIVKLLWRESFPSVLTAAAAGAVAGLIYTWTVLHLLGTVWKGATHTEGFRLYPYFTTIAACVFSGIVLSLSVLYFHIAGALKNKQAAKRQIKPLRNYRFIIINLILAVLLTVNVFFIKSPIIFVFAGMVFLLAAWMWLAYFIDKGSSTKMPFGLPELMWSSLFYVKKQAKMSFIMLASGVFIVFSAGLNRQGFADSTQIRTAAGGFSLWCETAVPVYHNMASEEGRAKLALKNLSKNAQAIQLLKYSADDASCLNLNRAVTPSVLGINIEDLQASGFKITGSVFDNILKNTTNHDSLLFDKFKHAVNSVYPALVDETVLTWSLGKKLGDTLIYAGENGKTISIQLAGTLQNSIFQGNILIDKALFSEIWNEISGSEIMLIRVPENEISETKTLVSQALNDYGVRTITTGERLKMFYSVTDTYLTVFLTLGGLGLLLGIFGTVIAVRKTMLAQKQEILLYRSLGFGDKRILGLLGRENTVIPLCAVVAGALGSLLGISMGLGNVSIWIWALAAVFLAFFIVCIMVFIKMSLKNFLRQI